ncbi:MAG: hypothetical protein MO846_07395 [Candidatus Devosia symbiotica]|nr:hypothetical protein [Candidatus Devosia symbiotica]
MTSGNMADIGVLVLLVAVGVTYLIDELGRQAWAPMPSLADGNPIIQTILGYELTISINRFRFSEQIRN